MRDKGEVAGIRVLVTRLNLRHLFRRRLRSLLTITGIAAGVALVFSISVINATLMQSFRQSVRDLAGDAEIEVAAADATGLEPADVRAIERTRGVDRAVPIVRAPTSVMGPDGSARILVLGITPAFTGLFPERFVPDVEFDLSELDGVILARDVAARLGVKAGDEVRVETPTGRRAIAVAGIASGGALGALNSGDVGAMLLPAAQRIFERQDTVDSVYVVVDPEFSTARVTTDLEDQLGGQAVVGPPGERSAGLERVFAGLGTLLSLGGTVALFTALFVVFNTSSMALAERRRELATALSLGATKKQVFAAFLGEAAVVGAISSILGIVGGLVLARFLVERAVEAYRVLPVTGSGPIVVTPTQMIVAAVGGLVVSVAGAYIPARRALGVAPIEALRPDAAYEWAPRRARGKSASVTLAGIVLVGLALVAFVASVVFVEQRWIPTVGIVIGMSGVTLLLPRVVPAAVSWIRPFVLRGFGTVGRLTADALDKNPGRTTFTVAALVLTLGVALGVGSALASYEAQVERSVSALLGAPVYVTADSFTGLTSDQPLEASLAERFARVEGVRYVYPMRFSLINVDDEQAVLYAVPVFEAFREGASSDLVGAGFTGDPDTFVNGLEAGGIAISRLTADRRDLGPGDSMDLRTPDGTRSFEVVSIYEDLLGFESIYIDFERYGEIWHDDKADEFGILIEDGVDEQRVRQDLQAILERRDIPGHAETDDELLAFIRETVEGTFALGQGIQFAALVVAALTIANTMFTAVFERRWEMGLQRAVGMSNGQLARSVLLEASVIGAIGGAGGAVVGTVSGFLMLRSMEAQFSWRVPFELPLVLIVFALAGGVAIAAGAGLLPSRMAVRAPIVESLRYE